MDLNRGSNGSSNLAPDRGANATATTSTTQEPGTAPPGRAYLPSSISRFLATQNGARALEWGKLISITGSAQVIVQALGFLSGILVIRLLPPSEYALYTLANTMLGTMTLLADGGIATGVMSQGGKVWKDKKKLGAVLATGLSLRKKFAVFSLLFAVPVLLYLLQKNGASWLMATLLIVSVLPAFFAALSGRLLEIAPKLYQDIAQLQRIQVTSNVGRLALNGLFLFAFPFAAVAILASGLAQIYANWRLRKLSRTHANHSQSEDLEVRSKILAIVKRALPTGIYISFLAQINIWLVSIFGSPEAVAQIGALGRLAIILSLFHTLFGTLIAPRFARLKAERLLVVQRFLLIQSGFWSLGIVLVVLVWLFPSQILWILGTEYAELHSEVVLLAVISALGLIRGGIHAMNASRGFILNPWGFIPLNIAINVSAYLIYPPVDALSALSAGVIGNALGPIIHNFNFWLHARKLD